MDTLLKQSWETARESLRSNYRVIEPDGKPLSYIVAGPRIYQQVWTRDFCYAAGGSLLLKDFAPVRDSLDGFLSRQREDGLFPKALSPWPPYVMTVVEYLGIRLGFKAPLRAFYVSEQFVVSFDSNSLVVWTTFRYAEASGDWEFARRHFATMAKSMDWYESRKVDGVIDQPPYSDWEDSVGRKGRVFYTNVLHWKALECMARMAAKLGMAGESEAWSARERACRAAVHAFFWDETLGAFKNADTLSQFDSGSNVMAITLGFSVGEEAKRILKALDGDGIWRTLGPRAATPDYPATMKSPYASFAGNHDYHDKQVWSWIVATAARAHALCGNKERAEKILRPMAGVIVREGALGEVYDENAQVKRWLARSESPFSWGAGLWLEALAAIGLSEAGRAQ